MAKKQSNAQETLNKAQMYEKLEEIIEKKAEEKLKQKLKKGQYANTPLELGQWTCDPECQDEYPDISKDEYLGNLDKQEYRKLTQDDELIGILMDAPMFFQGILPICIRRRKSSLVMSNSKGALARKLLSEDTINLKKSELGDNGKKGMMPFKNSFKKTY